MEDQSSSVPNLQYGGQSDRFLEIPKYRHEEVVRLLSGNGRLHNRVVHLNYVNDMPVVDGFICWGTALFESRDTSLENLLDKVVPGKDIMNAVENVFVVYHMANEGLIPVLRNIQYEVLNTVGFDERCLLMCRGRKKPKGKREYTGESEVYCETGRGTIQVGKLVGDYALVEDSEILFRLRDRKVSTQKSG